MSKEKTLDELEREIRLKKNEDIYGEVALELFRKYHYTNPIVLKNLKKELPLRVTLLNKITIYGMTLLHGYIIQYSYYFNDDIKHEFIYKPSLHDMNSWEK